MQYSKVVLAGGNGYIGKVLARYFKTKADQIVVLSRRRQVDDGNVRTVVWDAKREGDWIDRIKDADLLVNLCGKNVNCRYTAANQKEIIDSRVRPTTLLGKVIGSMKQPPRLWINVVSATIYRHAEDRPQDESTGELGYGFSIDVCRQWEDSFFASFTPATRKVALRMGLVLGKSDGVFPRLLNLVRVGMGGRQGDGSQMVSWIHEQDVARITEWLITHPLSGVINCVAPDAISNRELMSRIVAAYGIPFAVPMPQWLLELGAAIIGTETELILKSRWVKPERLLHEGYAFMFSNATAAVHDILSQRK